MKDREEPDLNRLLRPGQIAVIGGGAWCEEVIRQSVRAGYTGQIWPVHPKAKTVAGLTAYPNLDALPAAPDAAFVGINRRATIETVATLAKVGAGGAVCFASGFSEAAAEDEAGHSLQSQLIEAAGEMPILGPNCYGFINALDGALLWPDQHGCTPVDRGVAILTQSSNIAINLTMQQRALPIAYVAACGNMAQTTQAQIAMGLLDDPRVTAIGLHVEGFKDLRHWEALAKKADEKSIPLIVLKVGASDQAQQATISHTASLAGSDAGAQAFLDRLGIPRLRALPDFLETLKLLHCYGPLRSAQIASISCSGGEASLIADMAVTKSIEFPELSEKQKKRLRDRLGPMVALNNPLDYHTYIWRDGPAMAEAWTAMTGGDIEITLSIVDYPTTDPTDWSCATSAAIEAHQTTGAKFGVVATLPELMPLNVAQELIAAGVVPFMGLAEALAAIEAASQLRPPKLDPVTLPSGQAGDIFPPLNEAQAKDALSKFGMEVPQSRSLNSSANFAKETKDLRGPFVVKGVGLAHKTESGAVKLNVPSTDLSDCARSIGTETVLVEEMITGAVAELLLGVTRDPAHGFVLTLGSGGILTEIQKDTTSLLLPVQPDDVELALKELKIAPLLKGYRGQPAANMAAIVASVMALQDYVLANPSSIQEAEINPLLCTPNRAVAVDALIRKG